MNIKPISFTVRFNGKAKELKTPIKLYSEENINPGFNNIKDTYIAMWDTGSNMTVISDKLAKELNLKSIGEIVVDTANGKYKANKYLISISLPNRLNIENMPISSGNLGPGVDILIGLDLITLGDFSITNIDNKTVFSFRFPSTKEIDYVKEN